MRQFRHDWRQRDSSAAAAVLLAPSSQPVPPTSAVPTNDHNFAEQNAQPPP